ncbi:MAG: hypothetical protein Q4C98_09190 [Capnocytophaga sp.]|nr:hypothetical protein [Capnocytophaga sp.]
MENLDFNQLLRQEVEQVFGQKITDKPTSQWLSAQIQKEINESITYQTIRRFWGIIDTKKKAKKEEKEGEKKETKPFLHTKNVLSRYVCYKNFDAFCEYKRAKQNKELTTNWNIIKDWFSIKKHDNPLADSQYWHDKLSQVFAQFILTDETIFDSFCKAMHQSEVAMKYIISYHPMYDNLAKDWYFRGLNLFVRNSKELHYKLFEAILLFKKSVYTCQEANLPQQKQLIEELLSEVRKKYGTIWVLEARAMGCLLYFYKKTNDETAFNRLKNACFELLERHKEVIFELDNYDIFVFMLSDYCNVWQMPEISRQLQEKYSLYFADKALWRNGYNHAATLVEATTLFLTNEFSEAQKRYETIHIHQLNFDFKDYFTIQYQLLALGFCNKTASERKEKIKTTILHLIDQTGLLYFEKLIPVFEEKVSLGAS